LFFGGGKNRTSNPRITHTAIYIGNGKFIQSAGMVAINSMIPGSIDYDDYQSRTLVVARRMISAIGSPEISRIDQHPFYNTVKK
jgi:cell wall-associated NlpC family hydrolase